jgi:hypothetical protein
MRSGGDGVEKEERTLAGLERASELAWSDMSLRLQAALHTSLDLNLCCQKTVLD